MGSRSDTLAGKANRAARTGASGMRGPVGTPSSWRRQRGRAAGRCAAGAPAPPRASRHGDQRPTQSATNTFVSPSDFAFRFDAQISLVPSGLNMGKPSNSGWVVIFVSPVPSRFTR